MEFKRVAKPWFLKRPFMIFKALFYDINFMPRGWAETRTCFGVNIWCDNTKAIGKSIYRNGVYELATSELIWRLLKPGDVFFDVGANIGYYSLLAEKKLNGKGQILSFEPRPDILFWLKKNLQNSQITTLHPQAVSNINGMAELYIPKGSEDNEGIATLSKSTSAIDSCKVKCIKLDDLLIPYINVLKIDIEGHEFSALNSAQSLLENKLIEHIIFEEHDEINSAVIPLLLRSGFTVFSIGWDLDGLILEPLGEANVYLINDAKNYIATLNTEYLLNLTSQKSWKIFK